MPRTKSIIRSCIYRDAAERIIRKKDNCCCDAIMSAIKSDAAPFMWESDTNYCDFIRLFQRYFYPGVAQIRLANPHIPNIVTKVAKKSYYWLTKPEQEQRILMLLFMELIVEDILEEQKCKNKRAK